MPNQNNPFADPGKHIVAMGNRLPPVVPGGWTAPFGCGTMAGKQRNIDRKTSCDELIGKWAQIARVSAHAMYQKATCLTTTDEEWISSDHTKPLYAILRLRQRCYAHVLYGDAPFDVVAAGLHSGFSAVTIPPEARHPVLDAPIVCVYDQTGVVHAPPAASPLSRAALIERSRA
jgi:hypothetical protein